VPRIVDLVKTRIPQRFGLNPIRDIQVLCPMNRGGVGARSLNIELQSALNPASDRKVERFGWTFAPGDKVMQIENDYDKDVYNGDIGYIDDVGPEAGSSMPISTAVRSLMALASSIPWYRPMLRPSTRAKAPSTLPWLSQS
jgi:exodeoxyribonuclease V alpha subunit